MNIQSEQIVLSSVLMDTNCLFDFPHLEPHHFEGHGHHQYFKAMLDLHADGKPIDPVAIANIAAGEPWAFDVTESISGLGQYATGAKHHAEIVYDAAVKRNISNVCRDILNRVKSPATAAEILTEAQRMIGEATSAIQTDEAQPMGDTIKAAVKALKHPETTTKVLKTGIESFDRMVGGFYSGLVTVIAARPGMGKTALTVNLFSNLGAMGKKVIFFSLEDTAHFISLRVLARRCGVSYTDLVYSRVSTQQLDKIGQNVGQIESDTLWIDDKPGRSSQSIRHMCLRHQMLHGLDAVFVDHLGELSDDMDAYASTSKNIKQLRDIAKELDVPVVVLSQLSRKCEGRDDKRPVLSDLRDSGKIEEVARNVLMLYRDSVYNKESDQREMEVLVRKSSHSKTGQFTLFCDLEEMAIG